MIKRITQIIAFCLMSFCSHAVNVTFTVDMNCFTGDPDLLATQGATLNGGFNGWCGDCNPMMDNGDGTWSVTVDIPAGPTEFKFTVGPWSAEETFAGGESCTVTNFGFTNRSIMAVEGLVYSAAWNSCDSNCGTPPEDVTFTVDMSCYPNQADLAMGVFLNGGFNGWCGDCAPMTDNGDGTYSLTAQILPGDVEFKYVIGNWVIQEEFNGGEPCTITADPAENFTNRNLTVPTGGTTYSAAWNSCGGDCASVEQAADVTYCVCAAGAPAGDIYIFGSFNGWNPAEIPMVNISGDLWCSTLPLPGGAHSFKFAVDGGTSQEEFTGGEGCTLTKGGFTNRTSYVDGPTSIPVYDWNSCDETTNGGCLVALPMELISFDVMKENNNAQIEWTTEGDDSNNTFVIEYSRDAINFEEIGTVPGATARNADNNYSFKHYLLANGENYYRLKNVDLNENVSYSELRSLDIASTTKISINPTISNSNINIQLDDSQLDGVFFIYNILGEKVLEHHVTDTRFSIDIHNFSNGQYIGVVQLGESIITEKFIKN